MVQPVWQPAVSCKQTSNRLSNRLYRVYKHLPGCQIGWQPVWQQVVSCKLGFRKRPTDASSHPSIQPVIKLKCHIVYTNLSTERYWWVYMKLSSVRLIISQSLSRQVHAQAPSKHVKIICAECRIILPHGAVAKQTQCYRNSVCLSVCHTHRCVSTVEHSSNMFFAR